MYKAKMHRPETNMTNQRDLEIAKKFIIYFFEA